MTYNNLQINAIDCFCGIGGMTNSLEKSGVHVIAGIDIESKCKYSYEKNNHAKFINEDISKIDISYINNLFKTNNGIKVLVGCPPCQPFSNYSSKYRQAGQLDDKWQLLKYFNNIVCLTHPDIVAIENVPGLCKNVIFLDFIENLKKLNYFTWYSIINCQTYGIPQSRRRLVLLASKFGEIKLPSPNEKIKTVRDAIGKLPPIQAGETYEKDKLHSARSLSKINIERIKQSKPGGTWRDWDQYLRLNCHSKSSGKTYPSVYGRMIWDKPSPTITTQFYGYGNGRFGHPEQDRAISFREGALLQTFPLNYVFNPSATARELGIQIGNAVPVKLAEINGNSIQLNIKKYYVKKINK